MALVRSFARSNCEIPASAVTCGLAHEDEGTEAKETHCVTGDGRPFLQKVNYGVCCVFSCSG